MIVQCIYVHLDLFAVFDEEDCSGDGLTVELGDMLPEACASNVLMSCEETPMAIVEEW